MRNAIKKTIAKELWAALMIAVFLILMIAPRAHAATVTSIASGNWNAGATWDTGVPPVDGDDVIIANTHTVTLVAATSISSGSVTVNAGGTLALAGNNFTTTGGTFTNAGAVTSTGGKLIAGGGAWNFQGTNTANVESTALTTITDSVDTIVNFTNVTTTILSGGNLRIATSNIWTLAGSLTVNSGGTVSEAGAATLNLNYVGTVTNNGTITVDTVNFQQNITLDGVGVITATTVVPDLVIATTVAPTSLGSNSATLQGTIVSGPATSRGFQYGLTTAYGSVATEAGNFVAGNFSQVVTGLQCETTYHVRAVVVNPPLTVTAADRTFLTIPCSASVARFLDTTTPIVNVFSINNESTETISLDVMLAFDVTDTSSILRALFSNDADFSGAEWVGIAQGKQERAWRLALGEGEKTVYARFQDGGGNTTNVVTAKIIVKAPKVVCASEDQKKFEIAKVDLRTKNQDILDRLLPDAVRMVQEISDERTTLVSQQQLFSRFEDRLARAQLRDERREQLQTRIATALENLRIALDANQAEAARAVAYQRALERYSTIYVPERATVLAKKREACDGRTPSAPALFQHEPVPMLVSRQG